MKTNILKRAFTSVLAFCIVPGVVYLLFLMLRPAAFGQISMLTMLITQAFISAIIAWGLTFSMTAGNLDLSIGAQISVSTIVGCLLSKTYGIPGLIIGCLGTSLIIGIIKVVLMRIIRMSSMVISIAYTLVLGSLGAVLGTNQVLIIDSAYTQIGRAPWNIIITIIMGALMYYLHKYSVFGAKARAIGGNPALAESAGISQINIQSGAIMLAALYGGVASILTLSYGSGTSIEAGLDSVGTAFNALLGVFIAGVLTKYINIVFGVFAGILAMNIVSTGLVAINLETSLSSTVTGLFLLILMSASAIKDAAISEMLRREASLANQARREQKHIV